MTKPQLLQFVKDKIDLETAFAKQSHENGEMTKTQAIARKSFINGMEYVLACIINPYDNGYEAEE